MIAKHKTPSERGSTGGKGIAKQKMVGAHALMGAPKPYKPEPIRISKRQLKVAAGRARHEANNRIQAERKAARVPFISPSKKRYRSIVVLIIREREENGE